MFISQVFVALALFAASRAFPLNKRIAQTIADSTAKWEQACLAAGGGQLCNPQSQASFYTLLASAGPCDQQNQGDAMIDLAKQLSSDADMITLTQIFVQQPRNSPDSLSVPYCQQAPKNPELIGLFQCQFHGANLELFVGDVAIGGVGTIPFGLSSPLSPPGSCPANPSGPIAAGEQLTDITSDPGVGSSASSGSSAVVASSTSAPAVTTASHVSTAIAPPSTVSTTSTTSGHSLSSQAHTPSKGTSRGPLRHHQRAEFTLQNGLDAQRLNAQFETLSTSSPCTDGTSACVNGQFAQCAGGKFALSSCSSGLQCVALPLVNSAGTSVTCDTLADAEARISETGATGGLTGSGSNQAASPTATSSLVASASSSTTSATSNSSAKSTGGRDGSKHTDSHHIRAAFTLQNGLDAQELNAQFQTLSASAPCTNGASACVNEQFAQCSDGKFALSTCSTGLQCVALPLVNSAGTSITCDTVADAEARIAATGAVGGLTGANSNLASAPESTPSIQAESTASTERATATQQVGHGSSTHKTHGASKHN